MRRPVHSLAAVSGGSVALTLLALPVAAAGDSATETLVGNLSSDLIVLATTVALIFEGALLYALVRYRNSGGSKPPEYNPRLHLSYVVAVGVILLFVGFASFQTFAAMNQQETTPASEDSVRVNVTAVQWAWSFEYPEENVSSRDTLVVPANETVHLRITSSDVIHSFFIPELGVKHDANPARVNTAVFTPTNTGEFRLICAEYCGQGHSRMRGTVRVVDGDEFDDWLEEQRSNGTAARID